MRIVSEGEGVSRIDCKDCERRSAWKAVPWKDHQTCIGS